MSEKQPQPRTESGDGSGLRTENIEQQINKTASAVEDEPLDETEKQRMLKYIEEQVGSGEKHFKSLKKQGDLNTDEKIIQTYELFRAINNIAPMLDHDPKEIDDGTKDAGVERLRIEQAPTSVDKLSKTYKVVPVGWDEIKPKMLEKLKEPEAEAWAEVKEVEDEIVEKYGVKALVRGFTSPEQNKAALVKLGQVFDMLPQDTVRGKVFAIQSLGIEHTDGTLDIKPEWSTEEISDYLAKKFKIEGPLESNPNSVRIVDVAKPKQIPEKTGSGLDAVRAKYIAAKRAMDEFTSLSHLRNSLNLGGESKQRVVEALEKAQQEYEAARLEYVGTNLELHIQEQSEMRKARFEEYVTLNAGAMDKARGLWNKLGNVNYYEYRKSQGKEIQNRAGATLAKTANLRTAISLGLLGTGLYAGATAAGAGVLLARRGYGGFGATMGAKSLFEQIRMAKNNRPMSAEQFSNLHTVEEVQKQMAALEARALLSGQSEEKLLSNPDYQALLRIQDHLLSERIQDNSGNASESLQGSFKSSEEAFTQAQKAEKRGRTKTTAAALAAGVVGAGGVAKAVEYWNGEQPEIPAASRGKDINLPLDKSTPSGVDIETPSNKTELTYHGKGTGATVEVRGDETFVTAGNRGIEGALQDLKREDPERYKGMINWIKSQYPGTQAKDSTLIHRAIKKLAEQEGFTVDGGGKDLSDVDFAKVVLKPTQNGQFELVLDKSTLDFMDEPAPDVTVTDRNPVDTLRGASVDDAPIDTLRRVPNENTPTDTLRLATESAPEAKIGPEEIEVEKLNFNNLVSDAEKPNSIYDIAGSAAESRIDNAYEQALTQTDQYSKTSDALKHILKDDYAAFMKEKIQLDARVVNRLQKFPVSQFMQEYAHSKELPPKQLMELRGLADSINDLLVRSSDSERTAIRSGTIRQLLIRLASERMNK